MSKGLLVQRAIELLPSGLERLEGQERIWEEKLPLASGRSDEPVDVVYLTPFYFGEVGVAERIKGLMQIQTPLLVQEKLPETYIEGRAIPQRKRQW